jgi:L-lactate dehydrogenase (cytochrome)
MPGSDAMLLIDDFEYWAEKVLSGTAWNYYKSAADREISEFLVILTLTRIVR